MIQKLSVGILGGMGPSATFWLCKRIVELTRVENDQDHIEMFVHNNTLIPDRTDAISYGGESPLKELVRSARLLVKAGADFLVMPCVTAHYYYDDIARHIQVPFLHAIDETQNAITSQFQNIEAVGVLASTGAIASGLFQKALEGAGCRTLTLPPDLQETLFTEAIYGTQGLKRSADTQFAKSRLVEAGNWLVGAGAQLIIAGCTELPLALEDGDLYCPMLNPMEILARRTIRFAFGLEEEIADGKDAGGFALASYGEILCQEFSG